MEVSMDGKWRRSTTSDDRQKTCWLIMDLTVHRSSIITDLLLAHTFCSSRPVSSERTNHQSSPNHHPQLLVVCLSKNWTEKKKKRISKLLSYFNGEPTNRMHCSDSNFFPGVKPDKWLLLNRVIDSSDLRRQQIARHWQTRETFQRNSLTTKARLRHCIRRKDVDILRDAEFPLLLH